MDNFDGRIEGIGRISVDNFCNSDCDSYFLSHCHCDHMKGLTRDTTLSGPVYLSKVSSIIVHSLYPNIENLRILEIGQPTMIPHKNDEVDEYFTVTAIPAGHCPGSIMLLFEYKKRVLYTGDFRLKQRDVLKTKAFKNIHNQLHVFDKIYFDSTFLNLKYVDFPSPKDSIDVMARLAGEWLNRNEQNIVVFSTPANYGYEFALRSVSEILKQPIYVCQEGASNVYRHFAELDKTMNSGINSKDARVHYCHAKRICKCCPEIHPERIRILRLTAIRWTDSKRIDRLWEVDAKDSNLMYVCYSTHASFQEIVDLLCSLKPKEIHPIVTIADEEAYQFIVRQLGNHSQDKLLK